MSSDFTVVEVYEMAATIGRDLERLIDAVGSDLVAEMMPKVIRVLEELEACVKDRENGAGELQQLQEELRNARHVGAVASEENLRLISDVKLLDDQRQKEIRNWMAMAKELEQQNMRLKAQLSEKEGTVDKEKANEQDALHVLYQLKETVDNQRDQLRVKDAELATRALEVDMVDALQQHVDRLAKVTADLRRKNELLSTMAKNFIQEKSALQSELRAMEQPPEQYEIAGREVVDSGRQKQGKDEDKVSEPERKENVPEANIVTINMEGKAIIDLSDPNRPRFTLQELQTVLQERDELKLDIMELEDELQQYRPKEEEPLTEVDQKQQQNNSNAMKIKGEPSGIKKLFSFLFRGKNNAKPSSPPKDEGSWEFVGKPKTASGVTLGVPEPSIQRTRASSAAPLLSPQIPEASPVLEEESVKDEKRHRSYSGTRFKVSTKEPFKQRERMTCVRTESKQLVELGTDIASQWSPTKPPGPFFSRNNSNSSSKGTEDNAVEEQIMLVDRNAAEGETTQSELCDNDDASKISLHNNASEEVEVEM